MKTIMQLLTTFLLNAAWQVALVTALAFLGDWLIRNTSARYRHVLWVTALLVSIALPVISSFPPTRPVKRSDPVTLVIEPSAVRIADEPVSRHKVVPAVGETSPANSVSNSRIPSQPSAISINNKVAAILIAIYGGLLVYGCFRLIRAWARTRKIVASAYPVELPQRLQEIVSDCRPLVGSRTVRFFFSRSISLPITVGSFNPLIVLPESFLDETDEDVLTSAVGHEMAHVARWDYLTNLFYELASISLWFHPSVALIMRRIRETRELCCDESVTTKLVRPDVYARSLLRLIAATPMPKNLAAITIGITGTDNLEKRIMSLLKQPNIPWTKKSLLLIGACLLLIVPCVVGARLALAFEIATPPAAAIGGLFAQTPFGREQLRVHDEMTSLEHALQEQIQKTPQPKRAEIEKRLLEVQLNLAAHQRLIDRHAQQKPTEDEVRRLKELYAQVITKYPSDGKLLNEARAQLAEAEKLYAEYFNSRSNDQNHGPRLISGARPAYTDDARAKGITGAVLVTVTVGSDGTVQDVALKRGLFPSLDESALQSSRKLRFQPALENGRPVSKTVIVEFFFSAQMKDAYVDQLRDGDYAAEGYALRRRKAQETATQDDRARRQAELTDAAVISMDRAVQIATSKYPGKVLACSLGRDKDGPVFYHIVMVVTEGDKTTTKYVWVSAVDGTILKTEDASPRESVWRGKMVMGGVLNGRAINLPLPRYPDIARAARASGSVTVQIVVDAEGNVASAKAVSGHPLLQSAAVEAARQAKFRPTVLSGEPALVSGELIYNFSVQ